MSASASSTREYPSLNMTHSFLVACKNSNTVLLEQAQKTTVNTN